MEYTFSSVCIILKYEILQLPDINISSKKLISVEDRTEVKNYSHDLNIVFKFS